MPQDHSLLSASTHIKPLLKPAVAWLLSLTLAACASQTQLEQRVQAGQESLRNAGFEAAESIPTQLLTRAWVRESAQGATSASLWHVYIEGDGAAWQGQGRPSANPTPQTPVALNLALQDRSPRVIYLARPCQFFTPLPRECHFSDWTTDRYAPRQAARMAQVLTALIGEEEAILIGFSGGAHLALRIAELRPTRGIVAVAGNLDDHLFSHYHQLPPPGSPPTNPTRVPVWSISGTEDSVVPPQLANSMLKQVAAQDACRHHEVIDKANHTGPWQLDWNAIEAFQERCQPNR